MGTVSSSGLSLSCETTPPLGGRHTDRREGPNLMMRSAWSITLASVVMLVAIEASYAAGVLYNAPDGGWRYLYDGTLDPGVNGLPDGYGPSDMEALDGTWVHDQADKWDGSGPDDPLSDPNDDPFGNSPGGVADLVDGSTDYLRIQDPGNPELFGWQQGNDDPVNTNRRIFFAHELSQEGPLSTELVLDEGITISVRLRIPDSGPLHDIYTEDESGEPVILPWGSLGGGGYPIHNDGRGMFNVIQNDRDFFDQDSSVGFSLLTSADVEFYCTLGANAELCDAPERSGGLIMNNLVGQSTSSRVDTFDQAGLNLLPIADGDLREWRELWITIEGNGGEPGTHDVNVYLDGSESPTTFHVTATGDNNSSYNDGAFLTMGLNDNDLFGVFDIDFFGYTLGIVPPTRAQVANPCDLNSDGAIDAADAGIMFNNWGGSGLGDCNSDGLVDAADAGAMFAAWTGDSAGAVGVTNVPEPIMPGVCAVLLLVASRFSIGQRTVPVDG